MGLRETNATRTRQVLAETAMTLFLDRGYDATTMEDVAHAADVGISTVYRYFPKKEDLATAFLGDAGLMAESLRSRPDDEDPELSLGHALVTFLEHVERASPHLGRFNEVAEANPRVRGRLMDWFTEAHQLLCEAVAARRGLAPDDLGVGATTWMAIFVLMRTSERPPSGRSGSQVARDVMRTLAAAPLRVPRAPDDHAG